MKPVFRASSAGRILGCNGSPTMEARLQRELVDFGEDLGHPMIWLGLWAHYTAAKHVVEHHAAIGEPPRLDVPAGYKPPRHAERLVSWYISNLLTLTPDDHQLYVERYFKREFKRFFLEGHLDISSFGQEDFCINDLKAGMSEVEPAETNWQLAVYAALTHLHLPQMQRGTLRIYQRSAVYPISDAVVDDLPLVAEVIEEKFNEAMDNPYTLQTGTHCAFCTARLFCPAVRGQINEMKLKLTPDEVENLKVLPALEELGQIVREGRIVAARISDITDSFRERLAQSGGSLALPDGTVAKLVEEPGKRTFTNAKAAFALAQSKLSEEDLWDSCVELSVTAVEDALVEKVGMKRTSKKEESATSFVNKGMEHLIHKPMVKKLKFA